MNKPLWLRVLLQIGILLLLVAATLPLPAITGHLIDAADMAHRSVGRLVAELQVLGAALLFAGGAIAAILSWVVVRRPWDGLGASGIVGMSFLLPAVSSAVAHGARWSSLAGTAAHMVLVLAGCAFAAWLLQRRTTAPREATEG